MQFFLTKEYIERRLIEPVKFLFDFDFFLHCTTLTEVTKVLKKSTKYFWVDKNCLVLGLAVLVIIVKGVCLELLGFDQGDQRKEQETDTLQK